MQVPAEGPVDPGHRPRAIPHVHHPLRRAAPDPRGRGVAGSLPAVGQGMVCRGAGGGVAPLDTCSGLALAVGGLRASHRLFACCPVCARKRCEEPPAEPAAPHPRRQRPARASRAPRPLTLSTPRHRPAARRPRTASDRPLTLAGRSVAQDGTPVVACVQPLDGAGTVTVTRFRDRMRA